MQLLGLGSEHGMAARHGGAHHGHRTVLVRPEAGQGIDDDHLYGLVPVAVRALLDAGGRPDPEDPPTLDPDSTRGYWGRYPVVFGR